MSGIRALSVAAVLVTLAALPAAALKNEITAFGKAKLGDTTDQVRKVFPKMKPTTDNLGAQTFPSEHLERFVVTDVVVPETKQKGTLELRFWKGKLWAIIVYDGDGNDQKVIEALTKRMGPPNGTNPAKPGWNGDKSQVFVEAEHHWYSVTENQMSKDAQAWFYAYLQQIQGAVADGAHKTAPTTPAATPAAAPTPPAK
ncbi:MAG: hypothetical protein U0802_10120 [Candidatus Binatia bacterium]